MSKLAPVQFFRWDDIPKESVTDLIDRRLITGNSLMLAHVHLQKGSVVPKHSHENEQVSYVLEGALRIRLGDDGAEEIEVRAGEVVVIASNVPHAAEALANTLALDIFSPPRYDWLEGRDAYLRQG